MSEDLQSLLDRIQSEGVAKAEAEATRILNEAKQKAADILANAKAQEAAAHERAQHEANLFQERAEANVQQAARDVVLGVQKSIEDTLNRILLQHTSNALDPAFVQQTLSSLLPLYAPNAEAASISVPPAQLQAIRDALLAALQKEAASGISLQADSDLTAGFRISLANGRVEYDFSAQAIRDEMARLLRPELAALLH